ncbi:MAG: hypothetical protein J1F17_06875, partial [Oscillospiraceae bacterium]|nr:hypothetical protein [Oscillospiraceae bacterium]
QINALYEVGKNLKKCMYVWLSAGCNNCRQQEDTSGGSPCGGGNLRTKERKAKWKRASKGITDFV